MTEPGRYAAGQPEQLLLTVGDISVTQHWLYTPVGAHPLRGSTWTISDMTHVNERISPVGIILCLLFIWVCFLGLFFLLMKERTVVGYSQVTVQGNGFHYSTLIPGAGTNMAGVQQQVNYARSLAAVA